jgi:hypothetical protein
MKAKRFRQDFWRALPRYAALRCFARVRAALRASRRKIVDPFVAEPNPQRTRDLMSSLSNSAIEANISKISRPFVLLASTPSCGLKNSIPRDGSPQGIHQVPQQAKRS